MHNHIENIRKTAKKRGVKPTTAIIKDAIALCCSSYENASISPDASEIARKLPDIIEEVVRLCDSGELAAVDDSAIHSQPSPNAVQSAARSDAITQFQDEPTSIIEETEKVIARSLEELGNNFRQEDMSEIRQLAHQLSIDVKDTESLVNSLITAYLQKRNSVLSSALTQLERGRKAQNEEMYGGLDSDFFCQRETEWQRFESELLGLFN